METRGMASSKKAKKSAAEAIIQAPAQPTADTPAAEAAPETVKKVRKAKK
jgi:hypothetical protein